MVKHHTEDVMLPSLSVSDRFFNTLGLKWKFAPAKELDFSKGNKVVINELAISKLHLSVNPVGSSIQSGAQKVEIAGVVKNFNFTSMESAMQPLGLFNSAG